MKDCQSSDCQKFDALFNSMAEGVALHSYVYDKKGAVINYKVEDVNDAFEKILGIKKKAVLGKLATEAYNVSEPPYLEKYVNLKAGEGRNFDVFFAPLKKYFFISVSPWGDTGFATIFFDVTAQKQIEEELRQKNDNLEKMNKLMVDRELKMVALKEKLKNK